MAEPNDQTTSCLIESAVPLTDAEVQSLREVLEKQLGLVTLKFKIAPQLLGGLRLSFGGNVLDLSLSFKLDQVNKRLSQYAAAKNA